MPVVPKSPCEHQGFVSDRLEASRVILAPQDHPERVECLEAYRGGDRPCTCKEPLQYFAHLSPMPSSNPEDPQGSPQTQSQLPLLSIPCCGRVKDGPQVVQFLFQPMKPQQLFGTQKVRLGCFYQRQVVVCVHSLCGF